MRTTNRRIVKSVLIAVAFALTLLALRGVPSASADASDLKIEKTCGPEVFRPNEWTVNQCLIRVTNTGDTPISDITTGYANASGVIPSHYFILYEVDGQPRPIEPTGLSFGPNGTLQPGQSADVRLVTLLKMPREGVYDGEWPTKVDGEIVPDSTPLHYEGKADTAAPPKDLKVSQIGFRKDTRAVFETTITNNSTAAVTELSGMEHYGRSAKLVAAEFGSSEVPTANLVKWDLASLGKQSLAPGESLTLRTIYELAEDSPGYAQSGVLVEATVDGEQQLYGSSGGSVCLACGQDEEITPQPDSGSSAPGGRDSGSAQRPSTGSESVSAPGTGEGPSTGSMPLTLYVALAAAGAGLVATALLVRRRLRP